MHLYTNVFEEVSTIKRIKIKQIYYNMTVGITEPKFAVLEDGTQVIVKLSNGIEGNLVLFNEYVCYRLALLLDIPMPPSGCCIMDESTEVLGEGIATSSNYGYAFFSTYMPKTTKLVPSIINMMGNREDFIKLLLFDHIIFNRDRNEGNLLVRFYKNNVSLKVIDHSHVFINQSFWDSICLERAIAENDLLSTEILEYNKRLYDMFFSNVSVTKEKLDEEIFCFKNKINRVTIENIVNSAPNGWKPPQKDIDALVKYIMYRVDNLDVIESTILNYLR